MRNTRNKQKTNQIVILAIYVIMAFVVFIIGSILFLTKKVPENYKSYDVNDRVVKARLGGKFETTIGEDEIVVEGKKITLAKIVDPLTLSKNGNEVLFADDTYHFVTQNDHTIYRKYEEDDVKCVLSMDGEFSVIGDKYSIKNGENIVAKAKFSAFDIVGKIIDTNGNTLAIYKSFPFRRDFKVYISPDCIFEDDVVILMCCSYASDRNAKRGGSSKSISRK